MKDQGDEVMRGGLNRRRFLGMIGSVGLLALALTAQAGGVRLYAPTRWMGEPVTIPTGARSAEVSAVFTDHGGADVRLFLRQYDAAGKAVGDIFANPAHPALAPAMRGKRHSCVSLALCDNLRPEAVTVRPLAVVGEIEKPDGTFALHDLTVRWMSVPTSDRIANWIVVGETISFSCAPPPGKTGLRAVLTDSAGKVVADSRVDGSTWRWKGDRPGYYEVVFDWLDATNGSARATASLFAWDTAVQADGSRRVKRCQSFPRDRQAVVVTPRGPVSPDRASPAFGFHMSPHASSEFYRKTQYDLIGLLGMNSFLRMQCFTWFDIEREKGVYDWSRLDATLTCAEAAGYPLSRQIAGFFGTPVWNTTATDLSFGAYKGPHMYAPKDLAPWRQFVAAAVRRYPDLKTIEIWNEPHLPGYSVFWCDSSPEQFVDLMRTAYRAAKEIRPDLTVLMGGIGMRYLPFYERVVSLGIVSSLDGVATHCGYDMRAFRDCERRQGVPHKPYFEDEWHTVLYNCTSKDRPDEDACGYRMLRNLATLLVAGNEHVTGFGLTCGDHVPETADFYAAAGGIQQVYGLFRDRPFLEPRRAALALRTATDRFRGPVRKVGAWCFGEDGAQKAAVFASDAGRVAFVWNDNPRRPDWVPALTRVGARALDWEGHETTWREMRPRRVYFVENPDCARLAADGQAVESLTYFSNSPTKAKVVEEGFYSSFHKAQPVVMMNGTFGCSFSAALSSAALTLDIAGERPLESLALALDVEGRGDVDDVVEICGEAGGRLVKPRTPALMGDIPVDFSPAGATLTKSRADWTDGNRRVRLVLAMSDLYPFVHAPGKALRLQLSLKAQGGRTAAWGSGWSTAPRRPSDFGRLLPSGGGRRVADLTALRAPFGKPILAREASTIRVRPQSGNGAAGVAVNGMTVAPGSRLAVRLGAKGTGELNVVAWAKGANGKIFQRMDAERHQLTGGDDGVVRAITVPETAAFVDLAVFTWANARADFTLKSFEVVNE